MNDPRLFTTGPKAIILAPSSKFTVEERKSRMCAGKPRVHQSSPEFTSSPQFIIVKPNQYSSVPVVTLVYQLVITSRGAVSRSFQLTH